MSFFGVCGSSYHWARLYPSPVPHPVQAAKDGCERRGEREGGRERKEREELWGREERKEEGQD